MKSVNGYDYVNGREYKLVENGKFYVTYCYERIDEPWNGFDTYDGALDKLMEIHGDYEEAIHKENGNSWETATTKEVENVFESVRELMNISEGFTYFIRPDIGIRGDDEGWIMDKDFNPNDEYILENLTEEERKYIKEEVEIIMDCIEKDNLDNLEYCLSSHRILEKIYKDTLNEMI